MLNSYLSRHIDPSLYDVVAFPETPSEEEVCKAVKDATAIICSPTSPFTRKMLESAKGVRLIQSFGAAYDKMDLEAATELKIPVANNGGCNSISVAEHTLMFILIVLRKALFDYTKTNQGTKGDGWGTRRLLRGKTLGILGFGSIGKDVAKLARGFDPKMIYHKRNRLPEAEEDELGVEYRAFDQLLEESDILTVHVPLSDDTRGMIGEDEIAKMKDGAYIINTSRREVLDEPAVLEALREGKLSGFGTDFMLDDPLTGLENIMMTGHSAGASVDIMDECFTQLMGNVARALRGERLLNVVNDV
jgi:phosphoglycerate dehydrogenase-like enzyme